jgi:hypothetical protein
MAVDVTANADTGSATPAEPAWRARWLIIARRAWPVLTVLAITANLPILPVYNRSLYRARADRSHADSSPENRSQVPRPRTAPTFLAREPLPRRFLGREPLPRRPTGHPEGIPDLSRPLV